MQIRKLIACILTVAMALSMFTVAGAASTKIEPSPNSVTKANTNYSTTTLSKSATYDKNWANNKETEVTLTINSSRTVENPPVLVEFLVDSTQSLQIYTDYAKMRETDLDKTPVRDLKEALDGKRVYFGATIFTAEGHSVTGEGATLLSSVTNTSQYYDNIVSQSFSIGIEDTLKGHDGTNTQAGIREALKNLKTREADLNTQGIYPVARYLVLLADGGSFFYYDKENGDALTGPSYNEAGDAGKREYIHTLNELLADPSLAATYFERAILASRYEMDTIPASVNLITIGFPYYKFEPKLEKLTRLAGDAIDYAASKSVYSYKFEENRFDVEKSVPMISDLSKIISEQLASTVLCAIPAGSTITDVIGAGTDNLNASYDFDLMAGNTITLDFGGIKMSGTLSSNQLTFESGGVVYAELKYNPGGNENLVLTLKQPVKRGQTVSLSYRAKLHDTSSIAGTHIVDTNQIAYLIPQSTTVDPAKQPVSTTLPADVGALAFPKPTLGYTVNENGSVDPSNPPISGGGGGGKTLPELNTKDHYGYIIGYPEHYLTGEWTNYQPVMPVYPERNITRAEVATIYFRMLTDASRDALWTKENPFSDVPEDAWYCAAVSTLTNGGILSGYPNGKFRPNDSITRAEFAAIAVRFFGGTYEGKDLFTDISGHWARDIINLAATKGLINGYPDGTFRPDNKIKRSEAVTIVNRSLDRHPVKDKLLPDMLKWPDNMDTSKWYYAEMQEATNSHEYNMKGTGDGKYETWTKMLPIRDWVQFERIWSDAHSASNPGEVVNVQK